MSESTSHHGIDVVTTGVEGLDDVLGGGLQRRRLYLVEGVPGSGKTTLALQFLLAAARRGEPVLYITLSETLDELNSVAASHGWTLEGITVRETILTEGVLDPDAQATMFHPSEIELAHTTRAILADIDSMSELRMLSGSPLRHRRQVLGLKQYFASRGCIVLLLDDMTVTESD